MKSEDIREICSVCTSRKTQLVEVRIIGGWMTEWWECNRGHTHKVKTWRKGACRREP